MPTFEKDGQEKGYMSSTKPYTNGALKRGGEPVPAGSSQPKLSEQKQLKKKPITAQDHSQPSIDQP